MDNPIKYSVGDTICVFSKADCSMLYAGPIVRITANPCGLSMDDLLFVNPYSKNIEIVKETELEIPLWHCKEENLKSFKVIPHNDIDNTFEYDFFMWNDIEPEVKDIVHLLNQLGFVSTYSSCCGHGKIPAYVDFEIKDYQKFFAFLCFLREKCGLISYTYKHQELEDQFKYRFIVGVEGFNTCHLELVDVKSDFERLCRAIRKYLLQTEA